MLYSPCGGRIRRSVGFLREYVVVAEPPKTELELDTGAYSDFRVDCEENDAFEECGSKGRIRKEQQSTYSVDVATSVTIQR